MLSIFKDHFQTSLEADELFLYLKKTDETFLKEWAQQSLKNVSEYRHVIDIFREFSKFHLSYLDEMCKVNSDVKKHRLIISEQQGTRVAVQTTFHRRVLPAYQYHKV
jgi:hypothetical protein